MRSLLCCLFSIILLHCGSINFVNCNEGVEWLKEDLALPSDAPLGDDDYEIVQFWHRKLMFGDEHIKQLRFKRAGKDVELTMKETSIIREKTPVWLVYSDNQITKADDSIINDAVKFYQQPELAVTLATNIDEYNHRYFLGSISQETVMPLSNRTVRSLRSEKPHLFEDSLEPGSVDETGQFTLTNYHVLYKSKLPESESLVLPPRGHPEIFSKSDSKTEYNGPARERLRRTLADVVYPEILVVVDYNQKYTSIHEFRFLNLLMYTISFWNSVNHRYETLKDPQIHLRLTGIVVVMDREEVSIIQDAMISSIFNVDKIIDDLPKWIDNNFRAEYDIIMLQTNHKLCDKVRRSVCVGNIVNGLANLAQSCTFLGKTKMVGAFYDDMNNSGESTAAHEVGHILGAHHDDSSSPWDCAAFKGYIMSWNAEYKSNKFEWSRCSKEDISRFLRKTMPSCLDNPAPTGRTARKNNQGDLIEEELLPGRHIKPEYQCLSRGYTKACEATDICANLSCKWWLCVNAGPALEGTPCPGGECHLGKCRPKN